MWRPLRGLWSDLGLKEKIVKIDLRIVFNPNLIHVNDTNSNPSHGYDTIPNPSHVIDTNPTPTMHTTNVHLDYYLLLKNWADSFANFFF